MDGFNCAVADTALLSRKFSRENAKNSHFYGGIKSRAAPLTTRALTIARLYENKTPRLSVVE